MTRTLDVRLTVNGKACEGRCEPRTLLADFLRDNLSLTGTHVGCEHGACGACTILYNGEAARSCIMFAVQADGADIVTIEGIAEGSALHPLQAAFHEHHGLQCGFCTPGMIMTAVDIVNRKGNSLDEHTIRTELEGNLCRCTGYHNIVKAIAAGAQAMGQGPVAQAAE